MPLYEPGTTYGLGGWKPGIPGENIIQTVTDNGDGTGTLTVYDETGSVVAAEPCQVPTVVSAASADVLAAVQTARAEVAGYAESNGTRQAVEALATAVETLVQGDTP